MPQILTRQRPRAVGTTTCAIVLMSCALVRASSVAPMDLRSMADEAGAVIIATVVHVRSYPSAARGGIDSDVTFGDVEYLKGGPTPDDGGAKRDRADSLILTVPGGAVGDRTMRVCCATEFTVGQRRLLFLLPAYKTHPVVGLWQGSFHVVRDADGVDRVYQEGMSPIHTIGADWFPHVRVCPSHQPVARLRGERGVRLVRPSESCASGPSMTLADFRAALQPILDASRVHRPGEPIGRRIDADLTPVPLKRAGAADGQPDNAPATLDNAPRADQPEPVLAPAGKAGSR